MQDDAAGDSHPAPANNPLISPDIETLITQLADHSLESRLQLCSLFSVTQHHSTVSFCLDTLIHLQENSPSYHHQPSILSVSSDYSFIPRSYAIFFDYIVDILVQHLPPTLILLQRSSSYPKALFPTLSPLHLRYIYDQKLLGQLIKHIQTTSSADRRWPTATTTTTTSHKRKHVDDDEAGKLTDEQFIEKIIQHVSSITQWTDEQRRQAIYSYLLDERSTLVRPC